VEQGGVSAATAKPEQTPSGALDTGLFMTLLGVFLGGVALNLTPCVYPLIPITASYFGGRSEIGSRQGYILLHGIFYILGLSAMNSALGVSAAFTGRLMGSMLQHPAVLIFVSSVLLLMALNFFGFWELRLPGTLNAVLSKPHTGYAQSLFMGLTLGIVAAPCIGPFIIGLLTLVAQKGDPLYAFLIFFTLSIGLGLPLFNRGRGLRGTNIRLTHFPGWSLQESRSFSIFMPIGARPAGSWTRKHSMTGML
jgi:thiol:disulfide interchange protein DsbD